MRKNIFDIVRDNNSLPMEVERITTLFEVESILKIGKNSFTLQKCVDKFYFSNWKNRNHCINVDDYLETLDYQNILDDAEYCTEDFLTLIELVYNFWYLPYKDINNPDVFLEAYDDYYHLQRIMNDCLEEYNYTAYIDADNERVYVVEDKPEVTAVAEIIDDELAINVIKYNHHSLKGDLKVKKSILLALGLKLESQRSDIKALNGKLESNVFSLLNNLNLRHNNVTPGDKHYKQYVADMDDETLEGWYDELYQMMLLCFLLLDNRDRMNRVDEINNKIKED